MNTHFTILLFFILPIFHQHAFFFLFFSENQIPHGFPTIDMGPQLKVVEKTRTATMLCAASGNPDPEISWFKDMLPVDIGNSNGRIKQLRSGTVWLYYIQILFWFDPILFHRSPGIKDWHTSVSCWGLSIWILKWTFDTTKQLISVTRRPLWCWINQDLNLEIKKKINEVLYAHINSPLEI